MLGFCNVRTISDVNMDTEIKATTLEFIAGEDLSKSDVVEIMSEGIPMDLTDHKTMGASYMPYTNDSSAVNYTWSRPQLLSTAHKLHAFHLNSSVVQTTYLELHHSSWPEDLILTWAGGIADENTTISVINSACWGEPIEIETNWWLIPSQGSNTASIVDSTGTTVTTNPSCIYLVYVDPATAKATRKYFIAIPSNYNSSAYGKPFILRTSKKEFIFIHKTYINGVYAIQAVPFKVDLTNSEEKYMDWVTRDQQLVYYGTGDFTNFGATCNFVDKEHGKVYFLGETQWKYWELRYNEDRTAFETPRSSTIVPNDRYIKLWRCDLTYNNYPTVQSYYNDLSSGFNTIRCKDEKHLLSVYNHYYHDFEFTASIDNDTIGTITDVIYPLFTPGGDCRVISQSFGAGGNYCVRDWEIASRYARSLYCNNSSSNTASKVPCLYKLSDTRYAMAYTTMLTNNIESSSCNHAWLGTPMVILDYCDKLHRIDWNSKFIYNSYVYNTGYPDPAYNRPFVFMDGLKRIQRLVSYYQGSYYNQGQNYHSNETLPSETLNLTAYKLGTKLEDNNRTIYCTGRVLAPAAKGQKASILAFINEKDRFD